MRCGSRERGVVLRRLAVAGAVVLAMTAPTSALAAFRANAASTGMVTAAATLNPVTSLTATPICQKTSLKGVQLSWRVTTSSYATGYTLTRTGAVGSVTVGVTTTSYTDSTATTNGAYTYTVATTYRQWTAIATASSVKC